MMRSLASYILSLCISFRTFVSQCNAFNGYSLRINARINSVKAFICKTTKMSAHGEEKCMKDVSSRKKNKKVSTR